MTDNEALGTVIRQEREDRGWSQADLGWRLGITAHVVHKIENGTRPVRALELGALAQAFECSADDLLQRAETPPPEVLVARAAVQLDLARRAGYRYAWAVARAAWAVADIDGPVRLEDGAEIVGVAGLVEWLRGRGWDQGAHISQQPVAVPVSVDIADLVQAAAELSNVPPERRVLATEGDEAGD